MPRAKKTEVVVESEGIPADRKEAFEAEDAVLKKRDEVAKLRKRITEFEKKLEIAHLAHPPADTSSDERLVEKWRSDKDASLAAIDATLEYQARQIEEMEAKHKRMIEERKTVMAQTREKRSNKEDFFDRCIESAEARVETAKTKEHTSIITLKTRIRQTEDDIEAMEEQILMAERNNAEKPITSYAPRPWEMPGWEAREAEAQAEHRRWMAEEGRKYDEDKKRRQNTVITPEDSE
jgi:predicted nuclease with TOPRIM domain